MPDPGRAGSSSGPVLSSAPGLSGGAGSSSSPVLAASGGMAHLMGLLLADARLPTGGHARSGSLEPALAAGWRDIPAFIDLQLRTMVPTEAATAVVARAIALGSQSTSQQSAAPAGSARPIASDQSAEPLLPADPALPVDPVLPSDSGALQAAADRVNDSGVMAHWQARTPSAALREEAHLMGAALARIADQVLGLPQVQRAWPAPVVLGFIAAATGITAPALARLIGYEAVQTITSAALKLEPGDPMVVAGWTHSSLPAIELMTQRMHGLTRPDQIPARSAPIIEQYAENHTTTTRRLFRA